MNQLAMSPFTLACNFSETGLIKLKMLMALSGAMPLEDDSMWLMAATLTSTSVGGYGTIDHLIGKV